MGMIQLFNCAFLTLLSLREASVVGSNDFQSRQKNERIYLAVTPVGGTKASKDTDQHKEAQTSPSPYLQLPVFQHSRFPIVNKETFSPVSGTGHKQLPDNVKEILLPVSTRPKPSTSPSQPRGVTTSCDMSKMRVQVKKSVLGSGVSTPQVTLGTCEANKSTKDSLHFEYDLGMCGSKRTIVNNRVAYSNTLRYEPAKLPGPIRRAVPLTLPIVCHFNRYHYSYKIGYLPTIQMRKVYKPMKNRENFMLNPRNDQWERLGPHDAYVMGKPMYFEAEGPSRGGRLYVHACHVTVERSHTSTPQFSIVENLGCMVESKTSRSRFIPSSLKSVVRFTVDAFLFEGMTGQRLYMHCSMSVGRPAPSPTTKACNYDTKAGRWVELYGPASVCSCCDSKCTSDASPTTKMITSRPWTMKYSVKSSPATDVTTPTTRLEEKDVGKVGDVKVVESALGGVKQVEVETRERPVKGFAVVEEEQVSEPRRTFEDIFGLNK